MSTRTIDFCIPFVGYGARYAEHLISNLFATARFPDRITISMTAHSDADAQCIRALPVANRVGDVITVPSYPDHMNFSGSANHSRAINALAARSDADITIFSDHDMAFLEGGWDARIEAILESSDLCGVAYQKEWLTYSWKKAPWLAEAPLAKYQDAPNLSFLAITKPCLAGVFKGRLTEFDVYLEHGGFPFRIVDNPAMARILGIPVAAVWWLDTGLEIPMVIAGQNLKATVFPHVPFPQQEVFLPLERFAQEAPHRLPEVFSDPATGKPLVAHFKKGSAKAKTATGEREFQAFEQDVAGWVKRG